MGAGRVELPARVVYVLSQAETRVRIGNAAQNVTIIRHLCPIIHKNVQPKSVE